MIMHPREASRRARLSATPAAYVRTARLGRAGGGDRPLLFGSRKYLHSKPHTLKPRNPRNPKALRPRLQTLETSDLSPQTLKPRNPKALDSPRPQQRQGVDDSAYQTQAGVALCALGAAEVSRGVADRGVEIRTLGFRRPTLR